PRAVAVVITVVGMLLLAFGSAVIGPAREGLPVLSRQPVRLFKGTVAQAREVFSGGGDDAAAETVVAAGGPTTEAVQPLQPSDPVATLDDSDEPLTVAEVRELVADDPARARGLVFLPGVSIRQATAILDRRPTPAQVPNARPSPTQPARPSTTT